MQATITGKLYELHEEFLNNHLRFPFYAFGIFAKQSVLPKTLKSVVFSKLLS